MYSLDINFIKDRRDASANKVARGAGKSANISAKEMLPLFLGVGVGLLLVGAVGGLWLFLQQQTTVLQERQVTLDQELGRLKGLDQQVKKINDEITQVTGQTKDLASVFNQIKPWSAILEDIRDRIPPGVQIDTIQQTAATVPLPIVSVSPTANTSPTASAPPTPPSPQPVTKIQIQGTARSFNDVNDFLLILQRSAFFQDNQTQLVTAKLIDNPIAIESQKSQQENGSNLEFKLPKVVQYIIEANLNDVTTAKLLRELERKGAVGLVTRIRTLQDKGVILK
ncbi:MAG TPA: PilN domain-containing protein [Candidatus Sericytochromatia bacterium]